MREKMIKNTEIKQTNEIKAHKQIIFILFIPIINLIYFSLLLTLSTNELTTNLLIGIPSVLSAGVFAGWSVLTKHKNMIEYVGAGFIASVFLCLLATVFIFN